MLFGRDIRLPADLLFSRPPDAPLAPKEYIEKLQARMERMHHLARERIGMASKKMKTRYDARESNRTQFPRRRLSGVVESETLQRTLSKAAVQLGRMCGKKKLSLQEALDLFQNLPSGISDVVRHDFPDEEVPSLMKKSCNLLESLSDS
ncbi:retrovirus-related Pol polyprotein from transposon 412 [Trichonephila clavipes]|nr:retrovirus-related Pol polyprotein from transposon 412 [Trichonephila clavipes]